MEVSTQIDTLKSWAAWFTAQVIAPRSYIFMPKEELRECAVRCRVRAAELEKQLNAEKEARNAQGNG